MSRVSRSRLGRTAAALVVASGFAIGPGVGVAFGQPAGGSVATQDPALARIDVRFAGGTVEQYVRALQAAAGQTPLNVIVTPEAAGAAVSPVELRRVDLASAMRAVESVTDAGRLTIEAVGSVDGAPAFYRVFFQMRGNGGAPHVQTEVFSISEALGDGGTSVESALSAVEAALALSKSSARAEMKFHEESRLLFARATDADLDTIRQVLVSLRNDARRDREPNRDEYTKWLAEVLARSQDNPQAQRIELEAELQMALLRIERAQLAMEDAKARVAQSASLKERGFMSDGEVRGLEVALRQREIDLREASLHEQRVRQRLDLFNSQTESRDAQMKQEMERQAQEAATWRARCNDLEALATRQSAQIDELRASLVSARDREHQLLQQINELRARDGGGE
ncbi:MAG: hypothetical protein H6811_01175 [Phycisphaeraceae bacterium]|nr:hypothetical protein [Phycisphaeraceae bacterium]